MKKKHLWKKPKKILNPFSSFILGFLCVFQKNIFLIRFDFLADENMIIFNFGPKFYSWKISGYFVDRKTFPFSRNLKNPFSRNLELIQIVLKINVFSSIRKIEFNWRDIYFVLLFYSLHHIYTIVIYWVV